MTNSDSYARLSDDRKEVKLYPPKETAEEWAAEAEENGRSLSRHLQELIHEARAYRSHELLSVEGDQKRIQELEEQVEHLEQRLEEKTSESSAAISFDPDRVKTEFLSTNYQTLNEIIQNVVESGAIDELLRQPIENQLYFLAAHDEVQYERGWGWKLTEGDE